MFTFLGATLAAQVGQAGEVRLAACESFCAPVGAAQLDGYRAQGLGTTAQDVKVGVVLWDEYKRVRPPVNPGEIAPGAGVAAPNATQSSISVTVPR